MGNNNVGMIVGGIVLVALIGGVWAYTANRSSGDAMMNSDAMMTDGATTDDTMMKDEGAMMDANDAMMGKTGAYEPYAPEKLALANTGKVVLFFRASWCPTCKIVDADIRAHLGDIPEGVTILDVNYDTETALKQKYGVTYQHTFVQVDAKGNQITKWSGSPSLTSLLGEIR